jgi:hypothetical protein
VPVALSAPECGLVIATLDKPGPLEGLAVGETKKTIVASVILEVNEGRLGAGVVLTPTLDGGFWHEADVAGLAFKDGKLSGALKVSYRGGNGKTADASYELQSAAEGGGTFKGTCSGAAASGKLTVLGLAVHRSGGNARVWLWSQDDRFVGPGGKGETWSCLSWLFKDGRADTGYTCFRKGYVNGKLADAALTLEGAALKGAFTAKSLGAAAGAKVSLDGRVLASCLAIATLRVGEKQEAVRVYGFMLHPEAAPPVLPGSETGKH